MRRGNQPDATILPIARTLERPGPTQTRTGPTRPVRAHARVSRSRRAERAAAAAIVVGASIRVEQFLWRRSLWLDEAMVVNNVVTRSYAGLLHPLGGEQGAPIGWLWVQRSMVVLFGNNEYALRAVPLASGIAALALVYWMARHVIGPWPAALAAWLLALSPWAVRYSVEVKQYSSDLAISAGLMFLAVQAIEHRVIDRRQDRRAVVAWGWIGAVAVWWSHPAVLVIAATAVVLAAEASRRHKSGSDELIVVLKASIPWVVSFAVDWVVSLRRLGQDSFLHAFWRPGFAPTPFRITTYVPWLVRTPAHLAIDPGGIPFAGVAAGAAVVGLLVVVWRKPAQGATLGLPLLVAIGAASVGAYPLRGRLALWLLPLLVIGIAATAGAVAEVVRRVRPDVTAVAAAVLALGATVVLVQSPARSVLTLAHDPTTFQDLRPLLEAVHPQLQPGDQVWVHDHDDAAARYYGLMTGTVLTHDVQNAPGGACVGNLDLIGVAARHRVWFVYAYQGSDTVPDEEHVLLQHLLASAHLLERIHRPNASAYLFDFAAPPDIPIVPPGDLRCVTVTDASSVRPTGLTTGPFGSGRRI